jgi:hypothetical protein
MATRVNPGTASLRSSRYFPLRSLLTLDNPVTLPPGLRRLATRPTASGSVTFAITIGTVAVAAFAALAHLRAGCDDHVDVAPQDFAHQRGKPVGVAVCAAHVHDDVAALGVADAAMAADKSFMQPAYFTQRSDPNNADPRYPRLLRLGGQRCCKPPGDGAYQEPPTVHAGTLRQAAGGSQ